ncbi:MAG: DUF4268 domain-containing protein [Candidatus Lokiarchaeota archaeon]|nr:DUF4268 domain-containing protein [Candidatus Lokiarchaeota archaeon]MBD3202395.1 DUF4268 domain-containing protein [Candidatus Lokiarchaeota archaeon]
MYIDKRRLKALLKWYKQEVGDDLIAVLVVDREGLLIEAITRNSANEIEQKFIGAFSALVDVVLKKITKDFDLGTFGAGTFDTDRYRFIFCEAGDELVLVTVLNALAMVDPYFAYSYLAAEKIARLFDGEEISPVIPKIIVDKNLQNITRKVSTLQKIKVHSKESVYKLILGGDGNVGKTSMVKRFVEGTFHNDYKATIGTNIVKKECNFEDLDSIVRFVIWDLAGQPQFKRIRPTYVANSGAAIVVFDVTNRKSFNNVKKWYDEIKKAAPPDIFLIIVGNKVDLIDSREVSHNEGKELAEQLEISYIETSAKTGENISEAFKMLALQLIQRYVKAEEVYKLIINNSQELETLQNLDSVIEKLNMDDVLKVPVEQIWEETNRDFIPWLKKNIQTLDDVVELSLQPIGNNTINKNENYFLANTSFKEKVLVYTHFNDGNFSYIGQILNQLAIYDSKIVIWISENGSKQEENVVRWLNEHTNDEILFFFVKIEVLKVKEYPPIPKFDKLCEPSAVKLGKRLLRTQKDLSKVERLNIEFWIGLILKIKTDFPEHSEIKISEDDIISIDSEINNLSYRYIIKLDFAAVEAYFNDTKNPDNEKVIMEINDNFKKIQQRFEEIGWHLSKDLEFDYEHDRVYQKIRYILDGSGIKNTDKWDKIHLSMIDAMKSLKGVLETVIYK